MLLLIGLVDLLPSVITDVHVDVEALAKMGFCTFVELWNASRYVQYLFYSGEYTYAQSYTSGHLRYRDLPG